MTYYSKRNKSWEDNLSSEFWQGFEAYINEIAAKYFLFENFVDWKKCSTSFNKIKSKMLQEIGVGEWPLFSQPSDDKIFDLIQFFFRFVSSPTEWHQTLKCGDMPTEFDRGKGSLLYTIGINRLFTNFKHPYKLKKGEIECTRSEILDEKILNLEFKIPDDELSKLINEAMKYFYSRNPGDKKRGLEKIVDAYQRLKTLKDSDVKKGVERITKEASLLEETQTAFGGDLKDLWEVANNYAIRHFETDQIPLEDKDFIEYLFYGYYNVIRLVLRKYGMIEDKKRAVEEKEELPF
ncbi:hypothetical protein KAW50_00165 [candidate division WOR-3 bacterium]|nr:hypothetical protein [candidate division WOR-3 bacterium]